jgi:DNA-binding GntR family transcriptional regulator
VSPGPKRADLISTVSDRLRELIASGRLAPGAPLIERELARRLAVSRGTARAALRSLQQEGYVASTSVEKYARFSVAPLTVDDLADLSTIMAALDAAAARMAAGLVRSARLALGRELAAINTRFQKAIERPAEVETAHELDRQFHGRYVAAAAGPRLEAQWVGTHTQFGRYTKLYRSALDRRSVTEHRSIIAAIRVGDPARAAAAAERNWLTSIGRAERGIRLAGEQGVW